MVIKDTKTAGQLFERIKEHYVFWSHGTSFLNIMGRGDEEKGEAAAYNLTKSIHILFLLISTLLILTSIIILVSTGHIPILGKFEIEKVIGIYFGSIIFMTISVVVSGVVHRKNQTSPFVKIAISLTGIDLDNNPYTTEYNKKIRNIVANHVIQLLWLVPFSIIYFIAEMSGFNWFYAVLPLYVILLSILILRFPTRNSWADWKYR